MKTTRDGKAKPTNDGSCISLHNPMQLYAGDISQCNECRCFSQQESHNRKPSGTLLCSRTMPSHSRTRSSGQREREREREREKGGGGVKRSAHIAMQFLVIDDLQNYCLGTRRGIAADRGRPAVGFVYIPNGKLVHFIFSLWPFSSKIMLQKARRGKEINRGVVDQPFSHLYFSAKMKKAKGCMGQGVPWSYMHTVLVTNNRDEPCQNLTSGLELGIIWAVTFSTHCSLGEQK